MVLFLTYSVDNYIYIYVVCCKDLQRSRNFSAAVFPPPEKELSQKNATPQTFKEKVSCQTGPSIYPKMTSLVVTLRSFEGLNFDRSAYVGQPRTRQSRSINASQCGPWDDVIRDGKERLGVMRNGHLQEVVCLILNEGLLSGKHTKSYGKWWFIVDFPIKNGDFP